jgi:hypothetical protein
MEDIEGTYIGESLGRASEYEAKTSTETPGPCLVFFARVNENGVLRGFFLIQRPGFFIFHPDRG